MGNGAGSTENQGPGKYNGFWQKWQEAMHKRAAAAGKNPK